MKNKCKIKNMSVMSDQIVQKVEDFVKPEEVNGVRVEVRTGQWHGHSSVTKKLIKIWMPIRDESQYPKLYWWPRTIELHYERWSEEEQKFNKITEYRQIAVRKNPYRLQTLYLNSMEEFVNLMAHEYRHQWQRRRPLKSKWIWGARKKSTRPSVELDACAYAKKMQRQWRHAQPKVDAIHLAIYLEEMVNWTGIEFSLTGGKDIPYVDIDDTYDLAWVRPEQVGSNLYREMFQRWLLNHNT